MFLYSIIQEREIPQRFFFSLLYQLFKFMDESMENTLLQKYGGVDTIRMIVGNFYSDILESKNLRPYFSHVDLSNLIEHQTNLLSHLLGGPNHYEGRDMELAHRHLSIKQDDFEEVAAILQDNLQDAGVEEGDIQVIMNIVAGYADQIIAK